MAGFELSLPEQTWLKLLGQNTRSPHIGPAVIVGQDMCSLGHSTRSQLLVQWDETVIPSKFVTHLTGTPPDNTNVLWYTSPWWNNRGPFYTQLFWLQLEQSTNSECCVCIYQPAFPP